MPTALIERKRLVQSVIGNSLIANLRPAERPYEVRDTRLKGLLLRVQPSGVMTFYVEYARGKRLKLGRVGGMSPAQARQQAKRIFGVAFQGGDPASDRRESRAHAFRSFVDEVYAPWAEQNIRTAAATVQRLKTSFPDLQNRKLSEITPWLIEKWRMARLKGGAKPSTVNRDLNDLKSSLAKAVDWGYLEAHPIAAVKRSKEDRAPAVRFLTSNEETRLRAAVDAREARIRGERKRANAWRAARRYELLPDLQKRAFADHLKPMVLLSLNTGLRRGELFGLRWADIDLPHEMLTVRGPKAKSGNTRHIPLNEEARVVLEVWRASTVNPEALVFPARDGGPLDNVRSSWAGVLRAAGVERFRWHDLRHTFASRLIMAGVDLNTVRELLGHSSYQMTLRYAHLAPEHKAAAVARLVQTQGSSSRVAERVNDTDE